MARAEYTCESCGGYVAHRVDFYDWAAPAPGEVAKTELQWSAYVCSPQCAVKELARQLKVDS